MNWPDWLIKLFGKNISNKLGLQEGVMDGTKPWYQSKTIWANVVTGLIGVYLSLITSGVHLPAIPSWVITLLSSIGIYSRVTATDKIS